MTHAPVYRCSLCETLFEADVADPDADGRPRCPQCGLCLAEPAIPEPDDFVVCAGTPFR